MPTHNPPFGAELNFPRLLVTGSREWHDVATLRRELSSACNQLSGTTPTILVSGACPTGADRLAEEFWTELGWPIERHPADWEQYGKRAGFIRNAEMAKLGADICVAFPLGRSPGTRMMIDLARKKGIPVQVTEG